MRQGFDSVACDGLSDLYKSRHSKVGLLFWIVILSSMFSLSAYSITQTIRDYINSTGVTKANFVFSRKMDLPDLVLCYQGGSNVVEMKRAGFSDMLIKALSVEYRDFARGVLNDSLEHQEFKLYIEQNNLTTKEQFYMPFGFKCQQLLTKYKKPIDVLSVIDPCKEVSEIFVNSYEPFSCLSLANNGLQYWPSTKAGLLIHLVEPNNSMASFYPDRLNTVFHLEIKGKTSGAMSGVEISLNTKTNIILDRTHFKRLPYPQMCKHGESGETSNDCFIDCFFRTLIKVCPCDTFKHAVDNVTINDTYKGANDTLTCTLFESGDCFRQFTNEILFNYETCQNSCHPICDEVLYSMSVTQASLPKVVGGRNMSEVRLGFDILKYATVEQVETFTLDMALANVGGIAGLYLGCSVVTVVQVFYYAITSCATSAKKFCCGKTINKEVMK